MLRMLKMAATCLAAAVPTVLVVEVPAAQALITKAEAGRDAHNWAANHCGKAWDWVCTNSTDPWPIGSFTGNTKAGSVSYYENGGWDEGYLFFPFTHRYCGYTLDLGPNGGTPLNINVQCN
jgi:hypothetical protein